MSEDAKDLMPPLLPMDKRQNAWHVRLLKSVLDEEQREFLKSLQAHFGLFVAIAFLAGILELIGYCIRRSSGETLYSEIFHYAAIGLLFYDLLSFSVLLVREFYRLAFRDRANVGVAIAIFCAFAAGVLLSKWLKVIILAALKFLESEIQ